MQTKPITNQLLFDTVVKHLLTQNQKSQEVGVEDRICLYRGPGGLKCAVGVLIPDEEYHSEMEGLAANGVEMVRYFEQKGYSPEQMNMMGSLQQIHDYCHIDRWRRELQLFSYRHNLEFNF
jgi:hypothetical protein